MTNQDESSLDHQGLQKALLEMEKMLATMSSEEKQDLDERALAAIQLCLSNEVLREVIQEKTMVRNLTNNVQFILDTVKVSTVVEVQGDRIRRRNDWMNWPPLATTPNPPHSSATSNYDSLAARMRNVGLEENNSQTSTGNAVHTEAILGSTSGESNRQSSMVTTSNGDGSGQSTVQTGSDRSCLQEA